MTRGWTKKSQVSMEYLMVMAFAFLLTMPLVVIFFEQSNNLNDDVTDAQIQRFANELIDAVDEVYYLGEPSQKVLKLYMPDNIKDVMIENNEINFTVESNQYTYLISKTSSATLVGEVLTFEGFHTIKVQAMSSSTVNISEKR
jgi:uncharacterized protein (UPF0333 family)